MVNFYQPYDQRWESGKILMNYGSLYYATRSLQYGSHFYSRIEIEKLYHKLTPYNGTAYIALG